MLLDGAMGSVIQDFNLSESDFRGLKFKNHPIPLKGNNDVLTLTNPELILGIHKAYIEAGADLIETNTFNSNSFSQRDYKLENIVYDLNYNAAKLAKQAIAETLKASPQRECFVIGTIGPTGKTCSISPDVDDPAFRSVNFDQMVEAYTECIEGLIDGGADIIMFETIFDTLNAKAGIYAISKYNQKHKTQPPVMLSFTITDFSGRTLTGQTVEAFVNSVLHTENLLSIGINCALGADDMLPHIDETAMKSPVFTSAHPNAGLPNEFGEYDQSPSQMAESVKNFATRGLVNIIGGCCGTTPEHIREIKKVITPLPPRKIPNIQPACRLSGLEPLNITQNSFFVNIGERTNVSGSRKFLRLIKEENYDEALSVAAEQVANGAQIIDINMDDAMIDAQKTMKRFVNLIAAEPDISRVPAMLDSSDFNVIAAGLKCLQGKGIVNSISLKEGEKSFEEKAREVHRLGAAILVMAFDENGQADTLRRRVEIVDKSCRILIEKIGIPINDIIIDPNVFAIATGIEKHNSYAKDFIDSVKKIKSLFPGIFVSGGISNVSFAFRGNNTIREMIHSVFLYHAINAGLNMGIVNAGQLTVYDEIPGEQRKIIEDAVLNRTPDAAEKLLNLAGELQNTASKQKENPLWRSEQPEQRIVHAMINGISDYIEADVEELRRKQPDNPVAVIEGPLMNAMNKVGELFGSGKMFLPQVVKSARVMKKAVAVLMPYIEQKKLNANPNANLSSGKILMATVKGDVHDIGKNIVSVVLRCNNYEVIDLGVMVPCEQIIEKALEEKVDIIGLSGLITPSLNEMIHIASELERRGLNVPLIIGGATTSKLHTAVKIAPERSKAPTIYVPDASKSVSVVSSLLNPQSKNEFISSEYETYEILRNAHKNKRPPILSINEARRKKFICDFAGFKPIEPARFQPEIIESVAVNELIPYIDWTPLFSVWELKGAYPYIFNDPEKGTQAQKLFNDAQELLKEIAGNHLLEPIGVCGFFKAASINHEDIIIYPHDDSKPAIYNSLREQSPTKTDDTCRALADFIAPQNSGIQDYIGAFAVTAGHELPQLLEKYKELTDDYTMILLKALADRLTEAFAEYLHEKVRTQYWAYAKKENIQNDSSTKTNNQGIRPAPGYPSCPDHYGKKTIFNLLNAQKNTGITLTENTAMNPPASVCGLYFAAPQSHYFHINRLGMDQLKNLAERSGRNFEQIKKNIAYLL